MNSLLPRLTVGFVTFAIGGGAHAVFAPRPPSAVVPAMYATPPPANTGFRIGEPSYIGKEKTIRRVSQQELVKLPTIGKVRVQAFEPLGDGEELLVTDAGSGKDILSVYLSDYNADDRSQTRFKVIKRKQFPSPLIIVISMNPGGSDCAWEASIIGVVNGQLDELTYEHLQTSNDGGFFIGDLGNGVGFGVAQWSFVWGEDEGHPPPHKYEITLYKWNGWRFEWHRVFRTRSKHNSGRAAVRALGLNYVDIRKTFPEWAEVDIW